MIDAIRSIVAAGSVTTYAGSGGSVFITAGSLTGIGDILANGGGTSSGGGGRVALQAASVSTGLPFAIVLLLACYALVKGLLSEPR